MCVQARPLFIFWVGKIKPTEGLVSVACKSSMRMYCADTFNIIHYIEESYHNLAKPEWRFRLNSSCAILPRAQKFKPRTYLLFGMDRRALIWILLQYSAQKQRKKFCKSGAARPFCQRQHSPRAARHDQSIPSPH